MPAPSPDVVARLPIFQRVPAEDRARLAAASRVQTFERGEGVFQEGDAPTTFAAVIEGHVKIFKRLANGRDIILHLCGAGQILGSVAVFEGRPYPASAEALERTSCLLVPRQAFFQLLEQSPSLVRGLLSGLSLRLIELTDRLTELTGSQVESRFARLFLKLGDQFGRPHPEGIFVPLALSRQELADLTGTTIETCIRVMSRWGREHLLITERDGFVLVNRAALGVLADGS
ncbi:MAG: Crp/Fnr family transcriptional regulator [Acidobacteria bacterium]|nr:Crp/Fnr family transcriptional regulator [Acidobacteriota bacterium]